MLQEARKWQVPVPRQLGPKINLSLSVKEENCFATILLSELFNFYWRKCQLQLFSQFPIHVPMGFYALFVFCFSFLSKYLPPQQCIALFLYSSFYLLQNPTLCRSPKGDYFFNNQKKSMIKFSLRAKRVTKRCL